MPKGQGRQESGPESQEGVVGDAVPRNGAELQATRRNHMREQTMARQAAERKAMRPAATSRHDRATRKAEDRERAAALHVELRRINAEHQTWLHEHGLTDPPESASPPKGDVAPE